MLIVSRQNVTLIDSDLKNTFNDVDLTISRNEKILGVHVDQTFVWNNHFVGLYLKDIIGPLVIITDSNIS